MRKVSAFIWASVGTVLVLVVPPYLIGAVPPFPTPAFERIGVGSYYIDVPAGTRQRLATVTFGKSDRLQVRWPIVVIDLDGNSGKGLARGYYTLAQALAEIRGDERTVIFSEGEPGYEGALAELWRRERLIDRFSPPGG